LRVGGNGSARPHFTALRGQVLIHVRKFNVSFR